MDGAQWDNERHQVVDCTDKTILCLDTVPDDLEEVLKVSKLVRVLDHHKKPNQKILQKLQVKYSNLQVVFEIGKCAAELVWEYYCSGVPKPWMLNVVGAHDCLRWKTCAFYLEPLWIMLFEKQKFTMEKYKQFEAFRSYEISCWVIRGLHLLQQRDTEIKEIIQDAKLVILFGEPCYLLHNPGRKHKNKIGEVLSMKQEAKFSITYSYSEERKCWESNLRSDKEKFDVSNYAYNVTSQNPQYFVKAGGGHEGAAGIDWLVDPMSLAQPIKK